MLLRWEQELSLTSRPPHTALISSLKMTGLLNGLFGFGGLFSFSVPSGLRFDFFFLGAFGFFAAFLAILVMVSASASSSSESTSSACARLRFFIAGVDDAEEVGAPVVDPGQEEDDDDPRTPPMPGKASAGVLPLLDLTPELGKRKREREILRQTFMR